MRYLNAARPARRLESTTKSPILDLFGSTLAGLSTIRAFGRVGDYAAAMYARIDEQSVCTLHLHLLNRWVVVHLTVAGVAFTVVVAIVVLLRRDMDAALAGFVLSLTMRLSVAVLSTVKNYAMLELEMNAAERVVEFSEIPTEDLRGDKPPVAWPVTRRLEVCGLVVGYAPNPGSPDVPRGLTFDARPGERVGVVGRTGAGKSSLTLALFRFLEARSGAIYVDGLDIARISLQELRTRLAIIPQVRRLYFLHLFLRECLFAQ